MQQTTNILEDLGLLDLPEERKAELLDKMSDLIQKRVLLRIVKMLSDKDKNDLDKVLEKGDAVQIQDFLMSKVPNLDEITQEEVNDFKKEVKAHVANLKL